MTILTDSKATVSGFVKSWLLPPAVLELIHQGKNSLARSRLSAEDRNLLSKTRELQGRHVGQRCFILGAGSSLKQQDLKKLRGETVLSVSNTFVHPDYPLFRPHYHVLPPLLQSHGVLYPAEKFVSWLQQMEKATPDAEMFFHIGDRAMIEGAELFRNHTIHWVEYSGSREANNRPIDLSRIPQIWSVSELVITAAVYMGFEQIYLLGIDHDWFNGNLVYFYDHKKEHAMKPEEANLRNMGVDSEFQMRRHADIFKKYKYIYGIYRNIFNANADPAHYLDVFPKVDFDSLFG